MKSEKKIKVSVIIPTYNRAKLVCEAIDSVLNQTYPAYEIIVIDDGSTDNTRKILNDKYGKKIKYFFQKNKGPSAARNLGIKKSKGTLIAFLDADDIWLSNKLEEQIQFYKKHINQEIGMIDAFSTVIDKSGKEIAKLNTVKNGLCFKQMLYSNCINGTPTVIIPKKVFDKVGLFDEKLRGAEDHELWLRISPKFKIYTVEKYLVNIRKHESNVSNNYEFMEKSARKFLANVIKKNNHDISESEKRKIMSSNLTYYMNLYFKAKKYDKFISLFNECMQQHPKIIYSKPFKYSSKYIYSIMNIKKLQKK